MCIVHLNHNVTRTDPLHILLLIRVNYSLAQHHPFRYGHLISFECWFASHAELKPDTKQRLSFPSPPYPASS